jgi:hypothetical protein
MESQENWYLEDMVALGAAARHLRRAGAKAHFWKTGEGRKEGKKEGRKGGRN